MVIYDVNNQQPAPGKPLLVPTRHANSLVAMATVAMVTTSMGRAGRALYVYHP